MATQKPTPITAAVVTDDFTVTPVALDASRTLEEFYRLINCRFVDVVALDENLDMWVDDEGMCTGSTPNWAITKVAQAFGFTAQPYFGTAVFTGGVDEDGNSVALAPEVLQALTGVAPVGPGQIGPGPRTQIEPDMPPYRHNDITPVFITYLSPAIVRTGHDQQECRHLRQPGLRASTNDSTRIDHDETYRGPAPHRRHRLGRDLTGIGGEA